MKRKRLGKDLFFFRIDMLKKKKIIAAVIYKVFEGRKLTKKMLLKRFLCIFKKDENNAKILPRDSDNTDTYAHTQRER